MSRPDKRQRHKAKREAKRREMRRREGISPVARLAAAPGEIDCWMSGDFAKMGQTQIYVYKRAAGLSGIACFLIDRGVVGLKDAWARTGVERTEFDEMLQGCNGRGIPMSRVPLEDARRMIAGGVRWAYEHGMRLPKDWAKAAAILGGVGDWAKADVSLFAKEFAGHPEDLRQRLLSEPFDSFIRRKDIRIVFSDDAPYHGVATHDFDPLDDSDQDEEDEESVAGDIPVEELDAMSEQFMAAAKVVAAQTVDWLRVRGQTPSPELPEAWRALMLATIMTNAAMPDTPASEGAEFTKKLLKEISGRIEESRAAEYDRAMSQVREHFLADPQLVKKAALKAAAAK